MPIKINVQCESILDCGAVKTIKFVAVSTSTHDDQDFFKERPNGELIIDADNGTEAFDHFNAGKVYVLSLEEK